LSTAIFVFKSISFSVIKVILLPAERLLEGRLRRVMMKGYYQKSMRGLQACRSEVKIPFIGAGMSEHAQQCYTRSVRMLVDFYTKTPDQITEVQLQDYFLREWHTLELIPSKREQRGFGHKWRAGSNLNNAKSTPLEKPYSFVNRRI
jgi:hypothetical protein